MKDNFIRIEPFMTKNLGLRGFDLLVFAIIYGFTKTNGCYIGGHKYFVKEFGFDRVTVYRSIERLKKANLIIVEKVGIGLVADSERVEDDDKYSFLGFHLYSPN